MQTQRKGAGSIFRSVLVSPLLMGSNTQKKAVWERKDFASAESFGSQSITTGKGGRQELQLARHIMSTVKTREEWVLLFTPGYLLLISNSLFLCNLGHPPPRKWCRQEWAWSSLIN